MMLILIINQHKINIMLEKKFKYFFGYIYCSDDSIKSLPTKLPKLSGSIKLLEKVKYMSFMFNENH